MDTDKSDKSILAVEDLFVDIPTPAGHLHAVQGVGFTLEPGKTLGIVGESGCGKSVTTLATIRLLPKQTKIRAKRLKFAGIDLLGLSERQIADIRGDRIAMIFQEPMTALNPVFTIGNQLMEAYLRHRSGGRAQAREKALYLLDRVGIPTSGRRLRQYPHQLSGGLRQRVMIAMALMCDPDVIIADEPTTALDVTIQAQILGLLAELQQETGAAMIFVSHDLGVISRVADKVMVMYAGREVESGSVQQIFTTPIHPYTQGLFSCIPVPGKKPRYSQLGSIPGVVPSLLGDLKGCMFRPRCELARDACTRQIPYIAVSKEHRALCTASLAQLRARAEKAVVR
jgi:peptide/nickel transport system ATP-binding protein